jgi:uncharacterized membrane protein (DUF373 family)
MTLKHLFVTIIVVELFGTVIGYIKHRTVNFKLILRVGVTALVRRFLSLIGMRHACVVGLLPHSQIG